jgi:hypothetical protein
VGVERVLGFLQETGPLANAENKKQQAMKFAQMEFLLHNHAMGRATLARMRSLLRKKEVH